MRLENKTAIVTGAAAGQGAAVAQAFAREGAGVVVADLSSKGESVAQRIREAGGSSLFVGGDVSDSATWERLVTAARKLGEGADIVYHNAAMFSPQDRKSVV